MEFRTQSVTEEERAFLQQRVALFWKVLFLISLASALLELLTLPSELWAAGVLIDKVPTLAFGILWLVCRSGRRSVASVLTVEAVGLALASVFVSLMGRYLVPDLVAFLGGAGARSAPIDVAAVDFYAAIMILFGGSILFILRAALVPSPPWRTFALTTVLGLPYVLIPYLFGPAAEGDLPARRVASAGASAATISHAIWWLMVAVSAAVISHVIYGLRREVRNARRLGQYTLEGKLGEGGMGVVYRARHGMMRRPTAVKLLKPERTGEDSLKRFEREVQLTARLTHPHTITIFDYGRTPQGVFYYAMELLDGTSLDRVVSLGGALPPSRVIHVLYHVGAALTEAHEAGLIHRDIKPANIILCRQGGMEDFPKVVDFGLVKDLERGTELTRADTVAGTPLYLAPEAVNAPETVGPCSDLYSLGAVGYFALTATTVFAGRTFAEVCGHHVHTMPDRPSARLGRPVPPDLEALILECLAKEPEKRPRGAAELCRRLESCADFGRWSQEEARTWWSGNRLRAELEPSGPGDTETTLTRLGDARAASR